MPVRWLLGFLLACRTAPPSACPAVGETAVDCPWADVARAATTDARGALLHGAPTIVAQLARDARAPAMLGVWGGALNFNQAPDGSFGAEPIVAPALVDELVALAGVQPRHDRVVHAGVQHTYGYLFSLLATPYGWKRARWVQPTIDDGFGFPAGTIAAAPVAGTLLGNVTWLAGSIAFAGEAELAAVRSAPDLVAPAVRALDVATLHARRLSETVVVGGKSVVLRTDFVDLPHPTAAAAALLVYSTAVGNTHRLITMFPISAASRDKYAGVTLGDGQPIATQYNAWIDGLTGTSAIGVRAIR